MTQRSVLISEDAGVIFLDLKVFPERNNYIISARVTSGEDLIDKVKLTKPVLIVTDIKQKAKFQQ